MEELLCEQQAKGQEAWLASLLSRSDSCFTRGEGPQPSQHATNLLQTGASQAGASKMACSMLLEFVRERTRHLQQDTACSPYQPSHKGKPEHQQQATPLKQQQQQQSGKQQHAPVRRTTPMPGQANGQNPDSNAITPSQSAAKLQGAWASRGQPARAAATSGHKQEALARRMQGAPSLPNQQSQPQQQNGNLSRGVLHVAAPYRGCPPQSGVLHPSGGAAWPSLQAGSSSTTTVIATATTTAVPQGDLSETSPTVPTSAQMWPTPAAASHAQTTSAGSAAPAAAAPDAKSKAGKPRRVTPIAAPTKGVSPHISQPPLPSSFFRSKVPAHEQQQQQQQSSQGGPASSTPPLSSLGQETPSALVPSIEGGGVGPNFSMPGGIPSKGVASFATQQQPIRPLLHPMPLGAHNSTTAIDPTLGHAHVPASATKTAPADVTKSPTSSPPRQAGDVLLGESCSPTRVGGSMTVPGFSGTQAMGFSEGHARLARMHGTLLLHGQVRYRVYVYAC
eukprot:1048196-Pelagomonas_calceolata.AAC.4